jgi:hypothetical protein
MSKRKEKESPAEDMVMVSHKVKAGNPPSWQGINTCIYGGKLSHIAEFCYKEKNMETTNSKNMKDREEFAFATEYGLHLMKFVKDVLNPKR